MANFRSTSIPTISGRTPMSTKTPDNPNTGQNYLQCFCCRCLSSSSSSFRPLGATRFQLDIADKNYNHSQTRMKLSTARSTAASSSSSSSASRSYIRKNSRPNNIPALGFSDYKPRNIEGTIPIKWNVAANNNIRNSKQLYRIAKNNDSSEVYYERRNSFKPFRLEHPHILEIMGRYGAKSNPDYILKKYSVVEYGDNSLDDYSEAHCQDIIRKYRSTSSNHDVNNPKQRDITGQRSRNPDKGNNLGKNEMFKEDKIRNRSIAQFGKGGLNRDSLRSKAKHRAPTGVSGVIESSARKLSSDDSSIKHKFVRSKSDGAFRDELGDRLSHDTKRNERSGHVNGEDSSKFPSNVKISARQIVGKNSKPVRNNNIGSRTLGAHRQHVQTHYQRQERTNPIWKRY